MLGRATMSGRAMSYPCLLILPGLANSSMAMVCMLGALVASMIGVASDRRGKCSCGGHGEGSQSLPENTQDNG
jgi:hypothetical protein